MKSKLNFTQKDFKKIMGLYNSEYYGILGNEIPKEEHLKFYGLSSEKQNVLRNRLWRFNNFSNRQFFRVWRALDQKDIEEDEILEEKVFREAIIDAGCTGEKRADELIDAYQIMTEVNTIGELLLFTDETARFVNQTNVPYEFIHNKIKEITREKIGKFLYAMVAALENIMSEEVIHRHLKEDINEGYKQAELFTNYISGYNNKNFKPEDLVIHKGFSAQNDGSGVVIGPYVGSISSSKGDGISYGLSSHINNLGEIIAGREDIVRKEDLLCRLTYDASKPLSIDEIKKRGINSLLGGGYAKSICMIYGFVSELRKDSFTLAADFNRKHESQSINFNDIESRRLRFYSLDGEDMLTQEEYEKKYKEEY